MKHRFFGPLALLAALGAFAISAPVAGAEEVSSAGNEGISTAVEAVPSEGTSTTVEAAPAEAVPTNPLSMKLSPLSLGQCAQGTFCIWQANNWEGKFSYLTPGETGCHEHNGNPEIRSVWNRFGSAVELEGYGLVYSGERFTGRGVFKGLICY